VETEVSENTVGVPPMVERLLKYVALIGGFILFALMLFVSVAVFSRKVLNEPILGDFEIVKIGLSLVVMMAIPYVTLRGAHIRVDILDQHIGSFGRYVGDIFARLVSCFVFFLLIQKTWNKMLDAHKYGDVTNMIEIPVSIAYAAITAGFGLSILVLAGQLFLQIRQGYKNHE